MIAWAALGAVASVASASDELVLRGDSKERLSGIVTGIEESGVIVLDSPLTDAPLRLKPDTVARVAFNGGMEMPLEAGMLVELTNGDRLPVDVKSFSAKAGMAVSSPVTGDLQIPPSALSSLQVGLPERKLVFSGPGATKDWINPRQSGFENVSVEERDWVVNGRIEASRELDMPRNFVLRFQVEWGQRQSPNIKIHFASPEIDTVTKADRYFLQFNSAGFEIKREKSKGGGFPSILISGRRPEEFTDRKLDIEIHVNRMTRRIELHLDGQLEAWGLDPLDLPPEGSGIILGINGMEGTTQAIRHLTVHELNNARVRHDAEDRGPPEKDSLISRDEDRWTGELTEIRPNGKQRDFIFQTTVRKEPLEIPQEEVSTVFFREAADRAAKESAKFRIQLRGEGTLSVRSCRISKDTLTVTHPLLGELSLPKHSISRIEPNQAREQPQTPSE